MIIHIFINMDFRFIKDDFVKKFNFKEALLPFFCLLVFIIFHQLIENTVTDKICKHVFNQINPSISIDVAVILLAIIMGYATNKYYRFNSIKNIWWKVIILLLYIYYRFGDDTWIYLHLSFLVYLKYLDILLIGYVVGLITSRFKIKEKSVESQFKPFLNDEPIERKEDDVVGFQVYSDLIVEKIKSSRFKNSFAIGINGKWGTGKTSFLNLITNQLDKDDTIIVVRFNPWNSNSPNNIIKDFFTTLNKRLKEEGYFNSSVIDDYYNKLLDFNDGFYSKYFKLLGQNNETIEELHSEINNALKRIDKKLVITIDDLDRLDKPEILEVIRLIRNTANFYNTFFLVAYDRDYIIEAISQINEHQKTFYLEKIFQLEISIPYHGNGSVIKRLINDLEAILPEKMHEEIKKSFYKPYTMERYSEISTRQWIKSHRDSIRLANAISLNIENLIGEIDFYDFIRIELLRQKYPSVYYDFVEDSNLFLKIEKETSYQKSCFILKKSNDKIVLEEQLYKQQKLYSISENDISKIISLFSEIFVYAEYYNLKNRTNLSIIYPGNFYNYFRYSITENQISNKEFQESINSDFTFYKGKIDSWIEKKLFFNFRQVVESTYKSVESIEQFQNIILGVFYFNNIIRGQEESYWAMIGKKLMSVLEDRLLIEKLYKDKIILHKDFLKSIFDKAEPPYYYESDILNYIKSLPINFEYIELDDIYKILKRYLINYMSLIDKFDSYLWHLIKCNNTSIWKPQSNNIEKEEKVFTSEIQDIIIDFIVSKDTDGFLLDIINQQPFENKYAINIDFHYRPIKNETTIFLKLNH